MRLVMLPLLLLVASCAGHIETRALNPTTGAIDTTRAAIEGVVAYAPQYMKIVHEFTTHVDEDGNLIEPCERVVQKEEILIMPDFENGFVVRQTDGFLTGNKFSVTLDNGMLTSINAESTPQTAEILTTIPSLLQTLGLPTAQPDREAADPVACNSGPRIVSFTRIDPDTVDPEG